jgi:hypothetical protein
MSMPKTPTKTAIGDEIQGDTIVSPKLTHTQNNILACEVRTASRWFFLHILMFPPCVWLLTTGGKTSASSSSMHEQAAVRGKFGVLETPKPRVGGALPRQWSHPVFTLDHKDTLHRV